MTPTLTHIHKRTTDEDACPECGPHLYEIKVRPTAKFTPVTAYIFRSWTGERRIDGVPYHGPVYYLGSDKLAPGNSNRPFNVEDA